VKKDMKTGNGENPEVKGTDNTEHASSAKSAPKSEDDEMPESAGEATGNDEEAPAADTDDLPAAIESEASAYLELEKARAEASEYLQLAQRAQADLINYRKRVESERETYKQFAIEDLIFELVPVLDSLAQAEHMFEDVKAGENPLLDGVRKTREMLMKVFMEHGIEIIAETKIPFNPSMHQPLHSEASPDVVVEMVAEVYQQGVRIADRVIKPAMVRVLTPLTEDEEEDKHADEEPEEDAVGEEK
jgi:molecular chaperone GrpE